MGGGAEGFHGEPSVVTSILCRSHDGGHDSMRVTTDIPTVVVILTFDTNVFFPPLGISDHSPIEVMVGESKLRFENLFKYYSFWSKHPEFANLIQSTWRKLVDGSESQILKGKSNEAKWALKSFNVKQFWKISQRVTDKAKEVDHSQYIILSGLGTYAPISKDKSLKELYNLKLA
ncbi:hypothetical protein LIER_20644 [Lithospermum erythrorhizon]|uniref:Uncharacterized protein n=1 Tax=Lithospermum erythrorhizon TaxID=34254 RepID=A0AAV3QMA6_LITER